MLSDLPSWWPILTSVGVGCAVYGGIRADLVWLRKSTEEAHARIDEHMDYHLSHQRHNGR